MSKYFFDSETVGKDHPTEIIEAAWMKVLDGQAPDLLGDPPDGDEIRPFTVEPFEQRYRPIKEITFGAMAVHHILPAELDNCPPSSSFKLPVDCEYLIGHQIDFDWQAIGSPSAVKRICTNAMARWVWPDATGYSQVALMYMICGATPETRDLVKRAHGAIADVSMNVTLLASILSKRPEIRKWSQLWEFSEECRIPRTCPHKKYEGVLLEDLDDGYLNWCLRQDFVDKYFRKGIERVFAKRYPGFP